MDSKICVGNMNNIDKQLFDKISQIWIENIYTQHTTNDDEITNNITTNNNNSDKITTKTNQLINNLRICLFDNNNTPFNENTPQINITIIDNNNTPLNKDNTEQINNTIIEDNNTTQINQNHSNITNNTTNNITNNQDHSNITKNTTNNTSTFEQTTISKPHTLFEELQQFRKQIEQIEQIKREITKLHDTFNELQLEIISKKVNCLKKMKQYPQKSEEWYNVRKTMFTASSDIINIMRTSNKNQCYNNVINKKVSYTSPKFKGNVSTFHGTKYERICIQIYESRYNKEVIQFGLLTHPTIPYLGASPDGITTDGRVIEIKSPYNRIPNGIIKKEYFVQMQTQMEVCDLDVCDFFEGKIIEYMDKTEYDRDKYCENDVQFLNIYPKTINLNHVKVPNDRRSSNGLEKGMLGRIGYSSYDDSNTYIYPPMHYTSQEQYQWLKNEQLEYQKKNLDLHIDYWKMQKSSYNEVKRDKKWWNTNITTKLNNAWKTVQNRQKELQDNDK